MEFNAVQLLKGMDKLDLPGDIPNLKSWIWDGSSPLNQREELVYDITVEGIHNFVANNIIVHNCVYQGKCSFLLGRLENASQKCGEPAYPQRHGKKKKGDRCPLPALHRGQHRQQCPKDVLRQGLERTGEAFASYAFQQSRIRPVMLCGIPDGIPQRKHYQ